MKKFLLLSIFLLSNLIIFAQKTFVFKDNGKEEVFTAEQLKEFVLDEMITRMNQLNKQLPIQIDEYTVMHSAIVNGTTINFNYFVELDSSILTDEDIKEFSDDIKSRQKENAIFLFKQNADKMPVEEWGRLYKEIGIRYNYNYFDENR